jgi:hypothetical protein
MHAAEAGKSTLGIPKSVGKEFSDADKGGKLPKRKKSKRSETMYDHPRSKAHA